jgi:hypothetical protein
MEFDSNLEVFKKRISTRFDKALDIIEDIKKELNKPDQPERSKREDSQRCEMRCSEHCRNAVSEAL